MKWILKKLIVVLVEALIVMGLVDALGIDIEALFGDLLGGEEGTSGENGTTEGVEGTTEA